jgi:hypothetical protein
MNYTLHAAHHHRSPFQNLCLLCDAGISAGHLLAPRQHRPTAPAGHRPGEIVRLHGVRRSCRFSSAGTRWRRRCGSRWTPTPTPSPPRSSPPFTCPHRGSSRHAPLPLPKVTCFSPRHVAFWSEWVRRV